MSIAQIIQEAGQLRRSCEDQARILNDFLRANQANIAVVRSQLNGSSRGHDQKMLASLTAAESSLKKAESSLQRARDALSRMEMI